MADRRVCYIAHQLSAPTPEGMAENRERAARWMTWLSRRYLIAPVAPWIPLSSQWSETPENRATGLEIDRAVIEVVGTVILTGSRVSYGMRAAAGWATTVVDLTVHGLDVPPPDLMLGEVPWLRKDLDARMAAAGIRRAE